MDFRRITWVWRSEKILVREVLKYFTGALELFVHSFELFFISVYESYSPSSSAGPCVFSTDTTDFSSKIAELICLHYLILTSPLYLYFEPLLLVLDKSILTLLLL